ncbi:methylglutaconyl-CoA hydratase, mitochondrial-like [Daktulosphaira vitifoliae]|uniref:methylglutaconyl-CoA hydratase, mitochondrial-like n=1 Tax=Daktulosphaira vitifoliae TaxID=58002 RepID=UPI0021A9E4F3|nr:methylglutaconyl-CoA hydratase, mitochondrial-like [Daktulosphaira vitifoliae]
MYKFVKQNTSIMSIRKLFFKSKFIVKNIAYNLSTKPTPEHLQPFVTLQKLTGKEEGIAVVGLNRPGSRNAINKNMVDQLFNIIKQVNSSNDIRVVILRSLVKGIFCAGADLKERLTLNPIEVRQCVTDLRHLANAIENIQIPVIAAVDGAALGGGFELALSCDFIIASNNTKFGLVETRLGIIPGAGGTQRLVRIVGGPLAKELIYSARIFSANQALQYKAVNKVIEQNDQGTSAYINAIEIAKEILPNGPFAVKMAKKAIFHGQQVDFTTGFAIEEACYNQVIPTNDRIEGLVAFIEERKPKYTGS